jgi:hypothetical protein
VARVRLYLLHTKSRQLFQFIRPGGIRDSLPAVWLNVYIDLKSSVTPGPGAIAAAFPECVLDTGCHLTAIPERIWRLFKPGVVTPLPFDPAMPQSLRTIAFAGGTYPYDLGELQLRLRDLAGGVMNVTVVAQLLHDKGKLTTPMVLGLRSGVLDGRILRSSPDPAAPFGETWILEDP